MNDESIHRYISQDSRKKDCRVLTYTLQMYNRVQVCHSCLFLPWKAQHNLWHNEAMTAGCGVLGAPMMGLMMVAGLVSAAPHCYWHISDQNNISLPLLCSAPSISHRTISPQWINKPAIVWRSGDNHHNNWYFVLRLVYYLQENK